jgi:hypothetical protein
MFFPCSLFSRPYCARQYPHHTEHVQHTMRCTVRAYHSEHEQTHVPPHIGFGLSLARRFLFIQQAPNGDGKEAPSLPKRASSRYRLREKSKCTGEIINTNKTNLAPREDFAQIVGFYIFLDLEVDNKSVCCAPAAI